jgi:hypothetical protein
MVKTPKNTFGCFTSTAVLLVLLIFATCTPQKNSKFSGKKGEIKLIILNPGSSSAAMVLRNAYPQVDTNIRIYAPYTSDLDLHLAMITNYNNRAQNPTRWNPIIYKGPDFEKKLFEEKPGNMVVLAGQNRMKTRNIKQCIEAGFNVLAENPMALTTEDFNELRQVFNATKDRGILLYDMMTERYEVNNMLQRDLSQMPDVFGNLEDGTPGNPAIIQQSIHYFSKPGISPTRPAWFFDINQEGEALTNDAADLVDLVQWQCFPQQIINYEREISIIEARHWATAISVEQFRQVTMCDTIPTYLKPIIDDTLINVVANGDILYKIKNAYAKLTIKWDFENTEGHGDTHFSLMRGSKANLMIRQGKNENYKPALYIEPVNCKDLNKYNITIHEAVKRLQKKYEKLAVVKKGMMWEVVIPDVYMVGHEAHFAQVMEKYLRFLKEGSIPEWEIPNILAKYYTTSSALELATKKR